MPHLEVEIDMTVTDEMQGAYEVKVASGYLPGEAWRRVVQEKIGLIGGDVQCATLVDD